MGAHFKMLLYILTSAFKSQGRLEAENIALRHQVPVLEQTWGRVKRKAQPITTSHSEMWLFVVVPDVGRQNCRLYSNNCKQPCLRLRFFPFLFFRSSL